MRAGRLRHRITLQINEPTADGYGGQTANWTSTIRGIPAAIEPLNGRELIAAQAVQSDINVKISMRYMTGITAAMRLLDQDGTVYDIKAPPINVGGRNRELQIMAATGANNG